MDCLNQEFNGQLSLAISIFKGTYRKAFLHQLISSQLDVDRMDYLTRDSFYSGVSEGVIGYDRIIKMMAVHHGELVIEEKGVYSIEKFLVARRLMYWQAYLHKAVLGAENMLVNILRRAKMLSRQESGLFSTSEIFDHILKENKPGAFIRKNPGLFCALDDYDVLASVKKWTLHPDKILSGLCARLINRNILKTKLQLEPFNPEDIHELQIKAAGLLGLSEDDAKWFVFDGIASNRMYNQSNEPIKILFKDGSVKNLSEVEYLLIREVSDGPAKKFYLCWPEELN
jgi:HD superfamily phosphohydrolase